MTQYRVDGIQHIGPHHADLIDHQYLQLTDYGAAGTAHLHAGDQRLPSGRGWRKRRKRQLEEGVDGGTAGVDCSHARGSHYRQLLRGLGTKLSQEGGFSCSGFSGNEQASVGVGSKFLCAFIWREPGHIVSFVVDRTNLQKKGGLFKELWQGIRLS